ncbi:MAG TPA: hypothetical protein VFU39_05190, partial [Sulfuricaulis sp.]|nr:hypothetical protein [Sulfuricaulis sp.]
LLRALPPALRERSAAICHAYRVRACTNKNVIGFPAAYVGVTILDMTIGWTLAGLAVAKFAPGKS